MKTAYVEPVQEVVTFPVEDIITTSSAEDTTLPHMSDAGTADWDDGDHIDFEDLLGK